METNPTVVFAKPTKVILEDRPIPAPAEGELLVRTRRNLISTGTELTILNGQFPRESAWANYGKFPFTPGYNSVGEVIDTGLGVDKSWIGRKVACHARHTAYSVLKPGSIRPILRDISDEEAVFFTLAEIVMNGIRRGELTDKHVESYLASLPDDADECVPTDTKFSSPAADRLVSDGRSGEGREKNA